MKLLLIFTLLTLLLVACGQNVAFLAPTPAERPSSNSSAEPTFPPLPALDPAEITLGKAVYDQHCAVCHGANLEGAANWQEPNEDGSYKPPPHDETGHTWHHPDSVLIESIEQGASRLPEEFKGTSNMPAFGEILSDEEITAVLTYIKSTWPEETHQYQWEATLIMDNP